MVGDALGVPFEFCNREDQERDPVKDMRGYGRYKQPRHLCGRERGSDRMPNRYPQKRLLRLLSRSWRQYDQVKHRNFLVRPAIPIVFFGDSKRYFASPIRIITVGLNPSSEEFPDDNHFRRFPTMKNGSRRRDLTRHLAALNAYFCTVAYKSWFGSFEPILRGLGGSYYGHADNTVLHTDLCSPLATKPTWSGLVEKQRLLLRPNGMRLWHSLVKLLAPNVIIVSVAREHLQKIRFCRLATDEVIWSLTRRLPYKVTGSVIQLRPSKRAGLVFGRAAQTPFGTVSKDDKEKIGTAIKRWYRVALR